MSLFRSDFFENTLSKKFSFIFFFLLISKISNPQTIYTIPWAIQQPKFVFPIFIEDGVGNRDTLYLGYDPNASQNSFDTADQKFGVFKTPIDTNLLCFVGFRKI